MALKSKREYAVYKGDDLLAIGTAKECAEELGVRAETIRFYSTPCHKRRIAKGKGGRRFAIRLEDEE
jgi:hypothetical protein